MADFNEPVRSPVEQHRAESPYTGDRLSAGDIPDFDIADEAVREALYGSFGHYQDWRAVILSNCAEIVRATHKERMSNDRARDLAHTHPLYIAFITTHYYGKAEYSRDKKKAAGGGYGA